MSLPLGNAFLLSDTPSSYIKENHFKTYEYLGEKMHFSLLALIYNVTVIRNYFVIFIAT